MEMTTPPNPSGFNRKPTHKTDRKYRGKKPAGKNKAGLSHSRITPEIATYLVAGRLLLVAGRLLLGAMQILDYLTGSNHKSQPLRTAE